MNSYLCSTSKQTLSILAEIDRITHRGQKNGVLKEPQKKKEEQRHEKMHGQRPESYQRKIGVRDKAARQGVAFSLFEASCHHH